MKLNVANEAGKARRIGDCESTLLSIKGDLEKFKSSLNSGWKAKEIDHVNNAVNQVMNKLTNIAPRLQSIESDIITTARAIRREEDEKEAAELAAREADKK